jgi:hypothetical protein
MPAGKWSQLSKIAAHDPIRCARAVSLADGIPACLRSFWAAVSWGRIVECSDRDCVVDRCIGDVHHLHLAPALINDESRFPAPRPTLFDLLQ